MSLISSSSSSSAYSCVVCKKQYTRKSSFENHKILCEHKMKSKRERQIELEEMGDMPNHVQLVQIIQGLSSKINKMETKMEEMQQWVSRNKRKQKLNILLWLNTHVNPTIGFLEWVHTTLFVTMEHFEYFLNHILEKNKDALFQTVQRIFEENLAGKKTGLKYPIQCFSQKQLMFYIGDKAESGTVTWSQMEAPDWLLIMNKIQHKMMKHIVQWKEQNQHKFDDNVRLSNGFQHVVIQSMNIGNAHAHNLSRIKTALFALLKTDFRESETEFELDITNIVEVKKKAEKDEDKEEKEDEEDDEEKEDEEDEDKEDEDDEKEDVEIHF